MVRPIQITPVTATVSSVVAVIFFLPLLIVLAQIVKFFVRILVKLRFGENADLLRGCDAASGAPSFDTVDSLINLFMTIDGEVTREQIRDRLADGLVNVKDPVADGWKHPKLRSSFLWFWGYKVMVVERKKFDIDRHFVYLQGEDGGPVTCRTERDLEDALESVANQEIFPGDPEMPPWKFHVFYRTVSPKAEERTKDTEGVEKSTLRKSPRNVSTCLVLHIDHAIIDGGSLSMAVMPKLLDFEKDADPTVMFQNLKPFTGTQRLAMDIKGFLLAPLALYRGICHGNGGHDVSPLRRRGDECEGRYFVSPASIPMTKFAAIRKATDVKINSILSACFFRALCKFCKNVHLPNNSGADRREVDDERNWRWTLTSPQSLWVPGDSIELTNRMFLMPYTCNNLEVGHDDLLETLQLVKQTMEEPSRLAYSWSLKRISDWIFNAVPVLLWSTPLSHISHYTACFTNVRGPDEVQKCLGYDVKQMTAYVSCWKDIGVGLVTGSYAGHMTVTFGGRKRSFKSREEVRELQDMFLREIHDFYDAASKKNKSL